MALVYNSIRDGSSGASASSFGGAVRRLFLSERLRSAFRFDISIRHSRRCAGGSQQIGACVDQ
jgi:hypothetical protein